MSEPKPTLCTCAVSRADEQAGPGGSEHVDLKICGSVWVLLQERGRTWVSAAAAVAGAV